MGEGRKQQLDGEGEYHSWRGLGASEEGEEGHHLGIQEQVLSPYNPQVQRAECGSGGGGEEDSGHIRPHPSFPSLP